MIIDLPVISSPGKMAVNYTKTGRGFFEVKIGGRIVSCVHCELVSGSVNLNSKPLRDRS